MYRRILVPLDGSPLAEQVLPYVRTLGRAFQCPVHLLRAFGPVPLEMADPGLGISVAQLTAALHNQAHEALIPIMADLEGRGLSVSSSVEEGDAATHIIEEAEKEPATLIAICTHGRSGIRRWVLGSVTDKVLHGTTRPMLIVRARPQDSPPPEATVGAIISPLDGSGRAEQVLPHVVALAGGLGAEVRLVRVTPSQGADPDAASYLRQASQRLLREGVPLVEEQLLHGDAAAAIIDATQNLPGSLVAMTTRGLSGVQRWVMGSVTERVVRFSGSPTLVTRAA